MAPLPALLRTLQAAEIVGIRAVLLHAISADAKAFYKKSDFQASPLESMPLMLALKDASRSL